MKTDYSMWWNMKVRGLLTNCPILSFILFLLAGRLFARFDSLAWMQQPLIEWQSMFIQMFSLLWPPWLLVHLYLEYLFFYLISHMLSWISAMWLEIPQIWADLTVNASHVESSTKNFQGPIEPSRQDFFPPVFSRGHRNPACTSIIQLCRQVAW